MNENEKKYYFSIIKLFSIILLIIYFVSTSQKSLHAISMEWFLLAVTLAAALGYEMTGSKEGKIKKREISWSDFLKWFTLWPNKIKLSFLGMEIIITIILIIFFNSSNNGMFLIPIVTLDTITCFGISFAFSPISLLGIFLSPQYFFLYTIYCIFITIIYFQNFNMMERYREYLKEFETKEYQLKDSIHFKDTVYKEQLEKSSLSFENKLLEEKARLSQALHDKLGHSINGSIYQLEACKVLIEKAPEESTRIMQAVIDNLRTSMDEIRNILRSEKPDKKRMAYLQLLQLCSDCKEKYGIEAEFKIEGENKEIPELLWEAILDNTIEAVTNALKYAHCTTILIEIIILHKVVRCCIKDNGIGCEFLKEGMGLQGMKSRTRKVNGYIDISSSDGFHINMIFPLS